MMMMLMAILLLTLPLLAFAADCTFIGGEYKCRKGTKPIVISGFANTANSIVNGIYEPTDELNDGVTVYRKRGDADLWLEYGGGGSTNWNIKSTSVRGKAEGWAYVSVDTPCLPENIPIPQLDGG